MVTGRTIPKPFPILLKRPAVQAEGADWILRHQKVIGAWQPVTGRTPQDLPEAVRLLEKPGTADLLDRALRRGDRGSDGPGGNRQATVAAMAPRRPLDHNQR